MNRFGIRSFTLLFCLCLWSGATTGQTKSYRPAVDEFAAKQQGTARQNPAEVTFTVRFADNKNKFHQGELIRLELAFASSKPDAFSIDSAGYDRSGRLDIDTYVLDAGNGVSDPLEDYFQSREAFMMGGLRGNPTLTAKPYLINAELNEWHRFDKPGKYRLYVVSGRLMKGTNFRWDQKIGLVSNLLEFEVVPATTAWSAQTLLDAVKTVDGKSGQDIRRAACRTLRFLSTDGAAREMIRRFGAGDTECDFDYQFGLYGSPRRAFIVSEMERQLAEPEHPVSGSFLWTLSFLAWALTNPAALPPYPIEDEAKQASWQLLHQQRRDAMKTFQDKYTERLAIAVARKTGPALAISLATIYDAGSDAPASADLQARLASVFLDLPADRQATLLEYNWPRLAGPAMLPVLRKLYENPPKSDWRDPRSLALKRLYELAPEEGRLLLLKELRSSDPRVELQVLGLLPDAELPALEQIWAERITGDESDFRDMALQAELINRYGTGAVLPKLRGAFSDQIGRIACSIQTPLLRYFLRTDEAFGIQMLTQAMASRKQTRCFVRQLSAVADRPLTPALERLVLAHLNDPELETALDAVKVTGRFGSTGAEAKLWQSLTIWHETWQDREPELAAQRKTGLVVAPAQMESMLVEALATAPAWLADQEKLARMRQLCITAEGRRSVTQWLDQFDTTIVYFENSDGADHYMIAQYNTLTAEQLKTKLTQFPTGITFTWSTDSDRTPDETKVFAEFKSFIEANQMKLTR